MKTNLRKASLLPLAAAGFFLVSCEVEKTEEGRMPEIEVKDEGNLPKYDVDGPEVDVTTEKREVEVPKIEVTPAGED